MPNGHRNGSFSGPRKRVWPPPRWSKPFWPRGRIPSRASAPVWDIMRLGKRYGEGRLEAACRRAIRIGACSYKSIESILKHDLDQQPCLAMRTAATRDDARQYPRARSITTTNQRRPHMLNHPTLEKLLALKLTGMAKALSEQMALTESAYAEFRRTPGPTRRSRDDRAVSDRRLTTACGRRSCA